MSRLLLDTHVWLWALESPDRLAPGLAKTLIEADQLMLSVASVWEAAIKQASGKLALKGPVRELVDEAVRELSVRVLAVGVDHVIEAAGLPMHHKDPFDRVLIAQTLVDDLILVTGDPAMHRYPVSLMWASPV